MIPFPREEATPPVTMMYLVGMDAIGSLRKTENSRPAFRIQTENKKRDGNISGPESGKKKGRKSGNRRESGKRRENGIRRESGLEKISFDRAQSGGLHRV